MRTFREYMHIYIRTYVQKDKRSKLRSSTKPVETLVRIEDSGIQEIEMGAFQVPIGK